LGGDVTFITKRGNDLFGNKSIGLLMREGIDTQYVVKDNKNPSGVALISVDSRGRSSGVTAPGSNNFLSPEEISTKVFQSGKFNILLLQLEIPLRTVEFAAKSAFENGIKVIINPAPVQNLPDELLKRIWLITPNEKEAETLTGIKVKDYSSAEKAAQIFLEKGVRNVVISMGARGAFIKSEKFTGDIPAVKVRVVDLTAVGDVFNGALSVALAESKDFRDAVIFANKAASISATRMGAQASAPYRKEIPDLHKYAKNKSYAHFSFIR
jgi:ribokinase